jgi:hypothetical protein
MGTPIKRQVSKRPVSKRVKRQVYKCQVYKTSGLQNVRLQKKHPYIFCACVRWKSAGSVAAAMFAEFFLPYITVIARNKYK